MGNGNERLREANGQFRQPVLEGRIDGLMAELRISKVVATYQLDAMQQEVYSRDEMIKELRG